MRLTEADGAKTERLIKLGTPRALQIDHLGVHTALCELGTYGCCAYASFHSILYLGYVDFRDTHPITFHSG